MISLTSLTTALVAFAARAKPVSASSDIGETLIPMADVVQRIVHENAVQRRELAALKERLDRMAHDLATLRDAAVERDLSDHRRQVDRANREYANQQAFAAAFNQQMNSLAQQARQENILARQAQQAGPSQHNAAYQNLIAQGLGELINCVPSRSQVLGLGPAR